MTDLIHFVGFSFAMTAIGIGLWWVSPALALVGLGAIVLSLIVSARVIGLIWRVK